MSRTITRIVCLLLAMVLLLSMIPFGVFAEDAATPSTMSPSVQVPSATPTPGSVTGGETYELESVQSKSFSLGFMGEKVTPWEGVPVLDPATKLVLSFTLESEEVVTCKDGQYSLIKKDFSGLPIKIKEDDSFDVLDADDRVIGKLSSDNLTQGFKLTYSEGVVLSDVAKLHVALPLHVNVEIKGEQSFKLDDKEYKYLNVAEEETVPEVTTETEGTEQPTEPTNGSIAPDAPLLAMARGGLSTLDTPVSSVKRYAVPTSVKVSSANSSSWTTSTTGVILKDYDSISVEIGWKVPYDADVISIGDYSVVGTIEKLPTIAESAWQALYKAKRDITISGTKVGSLQFFDMGDGTVEARIYFTESSEYAGVPAIINMGNVSGTVGATLRTGAVPEDGSSDTWTINETVYTVKYPFRNNTPFTKKHVRTDYDAGYVEWLINFTVPEGMTMSMEDGLDSSYYLNLLAKTAMVGELPAYDLRLNGGTTNLFGDSSYIGSFYNYTNRVTFSVLQSGEYALTVRTAIMNRPSSNISTTNSITAKLTGYDTRKVSADVTLEPVVSEDVPKAIPYYMEKNGDHIDDNVYKYSASLWVQSEPYEPTYTIDLKGVTIEDSLYFDYGSGTPTLGDIRIKLEDKILTEGEDYRFNKDPRGGTYDSLEIEFLRSYSFDDVYETDRSILVEYIVFVEDASDEYSLRNAITAYSADGAGEATDYTQVWSYQGQSDDSMCYKNIESHNYNSKGAHPYTTANYVSMDLLGLDRESDGDLVFEDTFTETIGASLLESAPFTCLFDSMRIVSTSGGNTDGDEVTYVYTSVDNLFTLEPINEGKGFRLVLSGKLKDEVLKNKGISLSYHLPLAHTNGGELENTFTTKYTKTDGTEGSVTVSDTYTLPSGVTASKKTSSNSISYSVIGDVRLAYFPWTSYLYTTPDSVVTEIEDVLTFSESATMKPTPYYGTQSEKEAQLGLVVYDQTNDNDDYYVRISKDLYDVIFTDDSFNFAIRFKDAGYQPSGSLQLSYRTVFPAETRVLGSQNLNMVNTVNYKYRESDSDEIKTASAYASRSYLSGYTYNAASKYLKSGTYDPTNKINWKLEYNMYNTDIGASGSVIIEDTFETKADGAKIEQSLLPDSFELYSGGDATPIPKSKYTITPKGPEPYKEGFTISLDSSYADKRVLVKYGTVPDLERLESGSSSSVKNTSRVTCGSFSKEVVANVTVNRPMTNSSGAGKSGVSDENGVVHWTVASYLGSSYMTTITDAVANGVGFEESSIRVYKVNKSYVSDVQNGVVPDESMLTPWAESGEAPLNISVKNQPSSSPENSCLTIKTTEIPPAQCYILVMYDTFIDGEYIDSGDEIYNFLFNKYDFYVNYAGNIAFADYDVWTDTRGEPITLNIDKYIKGSSTKLPGVGFRLLTDFNSANQRIPLSEGTTNASGNLELGTIRVGQNKDNPQVYYIEEYAPPVGYAPPPSIPNDKDNYNPQYRIEVYKDGSGYKLDGYNNLDTLVFEQSFTGTSLTLDLENSPAFKLDLSKADYDYSTLLLDGARFDIYQKDDNNEFILYQENVLVNQSKTMYLPYGEYRFVETKAPTGYKNPVPYNPDDPGTYTYFKADSAGTFPDITERIIHTLFPQISVIDTFSNSEWIKYIMTTVFGSQQLNLSILNAKASPRVEITKKVADYGNTAPPTSSNTPLDLTVAYDWQDAITINQGNWPIFKIDITNASSITSPVDFMDTYGRAFNLYDSTGKYLTYYSSSGTRSAVSIPAHSTVTFYVIDRTAPPVGTKTNTGRITGIGTDPDDPLNVAGYAEDTADVTIIEPVGDLNVKKTDKLGNPLKDATFELYKADDTFVGEVTVTEDNGIVSIPSLSFGDYYLVETQAPANYEGTAGKIHFTFTTDGQTVAVENTYDPSILGVSPMYSWLPLALTVLLLGGVLLVAKKSKVFALLTKINIKK